MLGAIWGATMPEGLDHERLCGRNWNTQRCLRGRKCPLDETDKGTDGENWHSLHDVNRPGLADYSQVEKPPTIDGCVSWVKSVLDKLEPYFDAFREQLPNVPCAEVRWCWTAHLVADFAASYYYVGTGQQGKYKEMEDKQIWDFVTEVGRRILPTP
jgi:hypothetical protein